MKEIHFDHDRANESRADYGARLRYCTPDWGKNDLETDVVDALADVAHFLHRVGLVPENVFDAALRSAHGDLEDGPEAKHDPSLVENHGEKGESHVAHSA